MEENERLARIETSYEGIKDLLLRLDKKVDNLSAKIETAYVPRSEYNQLAKEVEELRKVKGALPAWAASMLSVLVTVTMFLAGLYFKK